MNIVLSDGTKLELPDFGTLLQEAMNRQEEWSWDGIIPARDITLIAAFMKKGKTTLLTGYVNGLLKTGFYCGLGMEQGTAKRVLYLAPEEGDTLLRKFGRLGFDLKSGQQLVVLPRGAALWQHLITQYRTRMWPGVVAGFKKAGFTHVVLDGLHTLLQMFEPAAKEDNEGVGRFMANFVLPFGSDFTVIGSLHTKKAGGDPRIRIPPEEMIRGASAWMAHPGQILVLEHDRKADLKTMHCFGRYETTKAQGFTVRYDPKRHDYVGLVDEAEEIMGREMGEAAVLRAKVMHILNSAHGAALGLKNIQAMISSRKDSVSFALAELEQMGMVKREEKRSASGRKATFFSSVSSLDS